MEVSVLHGDCVACVTQSSACDNAQSAITALAYASTYGADAVARSLCFKHRRMLEAGRAALTNDKEGA